MPLLMRLLARLPLSLVHALGAAAGWLAYLGSPTYRRHLRAHLGAALPGHAPALRRAAIAHAGRQALEIPHVLLGPPDNPDRLVRQVHGWAHVEAARARGAGIVFLTPHLGCFELCARLLARSAPITVLYRAPRKAYLRPLVEQGRAVPGISLAPADLAGVRRLIKALRSGQAIGLLPDQVPQRGEGQWAQFFGRPAYTMTLAARLTEVAGVAVLFCYVRRLPRGRGYEAWFLPPPQPIAGDTAARVEAINRCVEAVIRRAPEQYLWGYNRYKTPAGVDGAPP